MQAWFIFTQSTTLPSRDQLNTLCTTPTTYQRPAAPNRTTVRTIFPTAPPNHRGSSHGGFRFRTLGAGSMTALRRFPTRVEGASSPADSSSACERASLSRGNSSVGGERVRRWAGKIRTLGGMVGSFTLYPLSSPPASQIGGKVGDLTCQSAGYFSQPVT